MKRFFLRLILTVVCFFTVAAPGVAFERDLPVINGKKSVATVNDEPITLDELNRAISLAHTGREMNDTAAMTANNKAEGSAPWTLYRLAGAIVDLIRERGGEGA